MFVKFIVRKLLKLLYVQKLVKEFPACVEEVQDAFHFHIEPTAFDKQHKRNSPLTGAFTETDYRFL